MPGLSKHSPCHYPLVLFLPGMRQPSGNILRNFQWLMQKACKQFQGLGWGRIHTWIQNIYISGVNVFLTIWKHNFWSVKLWQKSSQNFRQNLSAFVRGRQIFFHFIQQRRYACYSPMVVFTERQNICVLSPLQIRCTHKKCLFIFPGGGYVGKMWLTSREWYSCEGQVCLYGNLCWYVETSPSEGNFTTLPSLHFLKSGLISMCYKAIFTIDSMWEIPHRIEVVI